MSFTKYIQHTHETTTTIQTLNPSVFQTSYLFQLTSPRQPLPLVNTRVGCHSLIQGIFLIQGLNPSLLHCRQILYHLSHQGSPLISEWVSFFFFPTKLFLQVVTLGKPRKGAL